MKSNEIIAACDRKIMACLRLRKHFDGTHILSDSQLEEECEVIREELEIQFTAINKTVQQISSFAGFS